MDPIELENVNVDGVPIFPCVFIPEPESYYVREAEKWTRYSRENFKLRLRREGLSQRVARGADLSSEELALHQVQTRRKVDFAIALAGWSDGLYDDGGKHILVTKSAKVLPAKDVPCPHLKKFLTELLGEEALPYQLGWWQWARRNIGDPKVLPGQIPIYIGPAGSGKSFLQAAITTRLLGGGQCSPYDYMAGRSSFNSELFECTHLVLEDRFFERGIAQRREFGSTMKELSVNAVQKCHPKGKPGITLSPKWRVTISLNDERENMNVLPPLDNSLLDKIMLFKCGQPVFPTDLGTLEGWEEWDAIVAAELPGLAYLIDTFKLGKLAGVRYGVKPWHDMSLLDQEREASPESILHECIRHDLLKLLEGEATWSGSALDLERILTGAAMPSKNQTRKVLTWPGACGTYLGRLAKQDPNISQRKVRGKTIWTLDLEGLAAELE